jgi:hypothetical protein
VKKGFEMVVRMMGSSSPMIKELAAYALGGACAGQRRLQQAAAKAKGTTRTPWPHIMYDDPCR